MEMIILENLKSRYKSLVYLHNSYYLSFNLYIYTYIHIHFTYIYIYIHLYCYTKPTVLTVRFHQYDGHFFPSSGTSTEYGPSRRHAAYGTNINIPFR